MLFKDFDCDSLYPNVPLCKKGFKKLLNLNKITTKKLANLRPKNLPRNSKTVVTLIYELTDPKSFRVRPMLDLIGHQYFCHYIQSHHFSHPIFLCLHLMKFSFVEARLDALKKKVGTEKLNVYRLKFMYSEKATSHHPTCVLCSASQK